MSNTKMYKCFIASPSDVEKERTVCDEIFDEINKSFGNAFNFRVESLKWENASPSIASEPQAVINEQLLSQCNLFIGILYCRFGTPTKNYKSGTEEEFLYALEKYQSNPKEIEIKMYFNDAEISPSELNSEQYENVRAFKDLVKEKGGLYKSYKGADEFKQHLKSNLTQYFLSIHTPNNKTNLLEERLNSALLGYADQSVKWVDRTLCKIENLGETFNDAEKIDIPLLINNPYSLIIEALPQFGLTCLAHHFVLEASKQNHTWIYLDASNATKNNDVKTLIQKECDQFNYDIENIKCIVLDSWEKSGEGMMKLLRNLDDSFPSIPIFIMSTSDRKPSGENINIDRSFEKITLLPLTKNNIRIIVNHYPKIKNDEIILNKVVSDLNNLNIHRTPAHCLMLLKILENPTLESPVNRAKMLSMLLSVIFDYATIPTYSSKPDVEHCEFILGFFCENMINNWSFSFSKDDFINHAKKIIEEQKLNIDVYIVFTILFDNRIFVQEKSKFRFRSAFWVYYFAAQRMKINSDFRNKILANEEYLSFVEMIEFYTGIDKNENELIDLLTNDLKKQCDSIENETGLTGNVDPLDSLTWDSTKEEIHNSFKVIKKEVLSSHLPDAVKDQYADNNYNIQKPYDQDIKKIYDKYFFLVLEKKIRVCSRALRNSDFIEPSKKTVLLEQITRGWYLFSKLIFALTPFLAKKGRFDFYGAGFVLSSDFDKLNDEEKIKSIIINNPTNITNLFYDDLYSERLSPIYFEFLKSEQTSLIQHFMILLLVRGKPDKWSEEILKYITKTNAKSAHLLDVRNNLIHTYKYDPMSEKNLANTQETIELVYTKKTSPNSKHLKDERKSLLFNKGKHSFIIPKRIYTEKE